MLIDLTGRTALVTGAGRSVGRGIAEVLASTGAFVYVNDFHEDRAAEVVAAIRSNGDDASAVIFDVTDASAVDVGFDSSLQTEEALTSSSTTQVLLKDPRRNYSRSRVPKTGFPRSI